MTVQFTKVSDLVKHTDGVLARHEASEIDGFIPSRFYDSIETVNDITDLDPDSKALANDFEALLQLSPLRANNLRAFDWNQQCKVLEIGCGSGLSTSFLAHKNLYIDALEQDRALAQLAAVRTRDYESTRIISEPFESLDFESQRYDVIILADINTLIKDQADNCEKIFGQKLAALKALLRDQGQVLIAVDNPYGLNYFYTASDQSRSNSYNYFETGGVEDLGGSMNLDGWRQVFCSSFTQVSEYYLFPDIYFPRVLLGRQYVESNLNAYQHLESIQTNSDSYSSANKINESLLYQHANKNGYLGYFSNGYIFNLSDGSASHFEQLDFAHLPNFKRRRNYLSVVRKTAQNNEIERLRVATTDSVLTSDIKQTFQPEPYYSGSQLSVLWRNSFLTDPRGIKFEQYLLVYFSFLKKLDAGVIAGMNVDAIANNIIVDAENEYHLIDHEWQITSEKIKSDYVFYRAMVHFALRNASIFHDFKWINGLSCLGDFLIYCFKIIGLDISIGELEPFRKRDCEFQSQVMLESTGYKLSDPFGIEVETQPTATYINWRYYDGHYHSHQKAVHKVWLNNKNQVLSFTLTGLEQNVECFRFFPFEHLQSQGANYFGIDSLNARLIDTHGSRLDLLTLRTSDEVNKANIHTGIFYGAKENQHVFMFNNNDTFLEFRLPAYDLDATGTIQIEIDFRLAPSHDYEIARKQYALAAREIDIASQIKIQEIDSLKEELEELTKQYDEVKDSRVWRLLVAYRDSFKIGGYPRKNLIGKLKHMFNLFKYPK